MTRQRLERDRQTEIAELGEEIVTALHDESDGIGAPAGMPHRRCRHPEIHPWCCS
jgi:hypothetical protein